ncbi:MAG: 2-amino-4-hydroxy-6-hydroxymethyldihydropteridine diphosphokinase [Actinomycetota bacterium]|nr:2-amino-4-hydroxy-6-hydroxymethyldihydropteridine diphosphokinase [Actinomycetota bacterium]
MTARAFVGVGSNLGDREATVRSGLAALAHGEEVSVVAVSTLRETEPVGLIDQPPFLNGAVLLQTSLDARSLLERLLVVERAHGRTRGGPPLGPRTLDLDLLLYGEEVIDEPGLTVPHPRLHERRFVLEPLAELDSDLVVPGRGPVRRLLSALD